MNIAESSPHLSVGSKWSGGGIQNTALRLRCAFEPEEEASIPAGAAVSFMKAKS